MNLETASVKELRDFAAKVGREIPKELTKRADILKFLRTKPEPSEATKKSNQDDRDDKAAKIPLTEKDKARLADLERLARSGISPGIDQMKELRIMRLRKAITPLSVVEKREMEELAIKAKGNPIDASNKSGLPDAERLAELNERSLVE